MTTQANEMPAFTIGQRVVQIHDGLRGRVVVTFDSTFIVQFDNGDDNEEWSADQLCDERDWDQAGRDLRAEEAAERRYCGYEA